MKLHFEPNLDYQRQAIEAVCGLFHGQETCRTEFIFVASVRTTRDSNPQSTIKNQQ